MKTIYRLFLLVAAVAGLSSCSNDIELATLLGFDSADARDLTVSSADVVLDGYHKDDNAVTFTWGDYDLSVSNADYGVASQSITPYLEFSRTEAFDSIAAQMQLTGHEKTFTNAELNLLLSNNGFARRVRARLFARIRYVLSENKAPKYSKTVEMAITPYGIIFNRMNVLATDKERVVGTIYSPSENGIYQGFVAATGNWMNFYLQERDLKIYGCVPDQPYDMTTDEDNMWNLWLQNVAGCYRVTANVNTKTWSSEQITRMQLIGKQGKARDMKFDRLTNAFSVTVTTTGAETFSAVAANKKYDIDNKDGIQGSPINFNNILSISKAGTWKVTLNMNGERPSASYEVSTEGESANYDPVLLMISPDDWNEVLCRMYSPKEDGHYQGFYHTQKGWENFLLANESKTTIWGCMPNAQFTLSSADGYWKLWGDETVGLYLYEANLADNSWSQHLINKVTVAGDFNGGSTTANPMTYDAKTKTWSADLNITTVGSGLQIIFDGDKTDCLKSTGSGNLGYKEGNNIMPPSAGKYRLTISLTDMQHLKYTFTEIK